MRKRSQPKPKKKLTTTTTHKFNVGRYGCSMIDLGGLNASKFTLIQIAIDVSASMTAHQRKMESLLKLIVKSWSGIERKNNVLFRVVTFDTEVQEVHGFQSLPFCESFDYSDALSPGGTTCLYDATLNGVESASSCGQYLYQNDFICNGLLVVIADGADNQSAATPRIVKKASDEAVTKESLVSFASVLVGLCEDDKAVSEALTQFVSKAGLSRYIEIEHPTASAFKQLAEEIMELVAAATRSLCLGIPLQDNPPSRLRLGGPRIESTFPNVAQWVRDGWIEIGNQDGRGFAARALDSGGLVYEKEKCRTLTEAMESLEAGIGKWLDENG